MSRASSRDRARAEPSRQLRRSARRLLARCSSPTDVRTRLRALAGQLRGRRAARRGAARAAARSARRCSRRRRCSARCSPASSSSSCSRSWCCCATATPTSARCTARRRRCVIIGDAFHNFIDGAIICAAVHDLGAARHQHRDRRRRARDPAGGRRRRHPARRRLQPRPRAAAERRLGRLGHRSARSSPSAPSQVVPGIRPYVLAFSAASLLYIAMSDLIPDLHRGADRSERAAPGAADRRRHRHHRDVRTADRTRAARAEPMRQGATCATVEMMWRREVEAAHHLQASRRTASAIRSAGTSCCGSPNRKTSTPPAGPSGSPRPPDARPIARTSSTGCPGSSASRDPNVVLHRLEQEENKAEAEYDQLMARLSDPADRKIAEEAMLEERDHAVVLRTLAGGVDADARARRSTRFSAASAGTCAAPAGSATPSTASTTVSARSSASSRGWPATPAAAKSCSRPDSPARSPARCRWAPARTSRRSREREVYESEVAREQTEIEEDPHEELLELELFYQLKGFSAEEARAMAERLQKEPKQFLRTLVHEELGLIAKRRFPTRGARRSRRPCRPRSAASSRSSRSSSPSACRR